VSDYTRLLARALAGAGDEVHVWAPAAAPGPPADPGVLVHPLPHPFGPRWLSRIDAGLGRARRPFRLLVQYTPHMYGWKAMNLPFCGWLLRRRRALRPWVMFHEVAFPCAWRQPLRHNVLGAANRVMAALLLRAAERVFVSTPAWEPLLRRLAPLRESPTWLPVPSNVALEGPDEAVRAVRARLAPAPGGLVVGHFGTFGGSIAAAVTAALPPFLRADPRRVGLLIGRGSGRFAERLLADHPALAGRVHAAGGVSADAAAAHLRGCDLLLQPYPDGVNGRRGSVMAGLALGVPVVTTCGAHTEPLWDEQGLAALAPDGDTAALLAAAERLAADADARRRLGERGRAGYLRYFSLENTLRILRGTELAPGLQRGGLRAQREPCTETP
jgi:glycosyltransferase involved in cell wall biosynthesis